MADIVLINPRFEDSMYGGGLLPNLARAFRSIDYSRPTHEGARRLDVYAYDYLASEMVARRAAPQGDFRSRP